MAFHLYDWIWETSPTSGTGDLVFAGAVAPFRTFSSSFVEGDTFLYSIYDGSGNYEAGVGTYHSGANSFSRTTVLRSSNGGAAVNFPAATKHVVCAHEASVLEQLLDTSKTGVPQRTGAATWTFNATVPNSLLANMASNSLKGNNTGSPATPADLTAAQTLALLSAVGHTVVNVQTFTASGTYTRSANVTRDIIFCRGGGGAGGAAAGASQPGNGGGQGAGAWAFLKAIGATETVTITAGGTTSFGTWASAGGGGAGGSSGGAGAGGTASVGDLLLTGSPGTLADATRNIGGSGGGEGGGLGGTAGGAGVAGSMGGGGGGGSASAGAAGGNSTGYVIVWELT